MLQVDSCKKNAFASYAMLMKQWNIKVVYFTSSPPIISACEANGVDVIKEYMSLFPVWVIPSVQVMNQAIFRELVKTLKQMYDASFYGLMDPNLLLSTSIGDVLSEIRTGSLHASLPDRVRISSSPDSQVLISGVALNGSPPPSIPSDADSYNTMLHSRPYAGQFLERCSSVTLSSCNDD